MNSVELPYGMQLYTIFKRCLTDSYCSPVLLNLTLDDANKAVRRLQPKQYADDNDKWHCVYYEKVEQ